LARGLRSGRGGARGNGGGGHLIGRRQDVGGCNMGHPGSRRTAGKVAGQRRGKRQGAGVPSASVGIGPQLEGSASPMVRERRQGGPTGGGPARSLGRTGTASGAAAYSGPRWQLRHDTDRTRGPHVEQARRCPAQPGAAGKNPRPGGAPRGRAHTPSRGATPSFRSGRRASPATRRRTGSSACGRFQGEPVADPGRGWCSGRGLAGFCPSRPVPAQQQATPDRPPAPTTTPAAQ